ncbi:hypothetical protein SELMODRAFT_427984 [Selaginella moellendorffii]|uniref:Uncharacterized protein n=1 Tax=Selaginella moellendorffii TaxID=88036 RepID=D8T1B9_SELML|nr:hypothetical protein SELMODRAFT_427984 [Selaginella moellendorffii]
MYTARRRMMALDLLTVEEQRQFQSYIHARLVLEIEIAVARAGAGVLGHVHAQELERELAAMEVIEERAREAVRMRAMEARARLAAAAMEVAAAIEVWDRDMEARRRRRDELAAETIELAALEAWERDAAQRRELAAMEAAAIEVWDRDMEARRRRRDELAAETIELAALEAWERDAGQRREQAAMEAAARAAMEAPLSEMAAAMERELGPMTCELEPMAMERELDQALALEVANLSGLSKAMEAPVAGGGGMEQHCNLDCSMELGSVDDFISNVSIDRSVAGASDQRSRSAGGGRGAQEEIGRRSLSAERWRVVVLGIPGGTVVRNAFFQRQQQQPGQDRMEVDECIARGAHNAVSPLTRGSLAVPVWKLTLAAEFSVSFVLLCRAMAWEKATTSRSLEPEEVDYDREGPGAIRAFSTFEFIIYRLNAWLWTGISYANDVAAGTPRRLGSPNAWSHRGMARSRLTVKAAKSVTNNNESWGSITVTYNQRTRRLESPLRFQPASSRVHGLSKLKNAENDIQFQVASMDILYRIKNTGVKFAEVYRGCVGAMPVIKGIREASVCRQFAL